MGCTNVRGCFGKRAKQLLKKILVLLIIQTTAWFIYTYIEEGFSLTDCIFNQERIKRLKAAKQANVTEEDNELHNKLNGIFLGEMDRYSFEIYRDEFKQHFKVKEKKPTEVSIHDICTKWYLFTAITLTTVGYGNVVPKTMAGKLVFFPFCLIGIPTMLFFLGYVGQLLTELCTKIVELLSCRKARNGEPLVVHKELKCFLVTFLLLWAFILIEAAASSYFPEPKSKLSFLDGVYFYFVSFTTIGYGDITTPMTQPLFEFRLYVGLILMSAVVNTALSFSEKITPRLTRVLRRKCCCARQHQSCNIEPAVEMVVVKGACPEKDGDATTKSSYLARTNNGYSFR